MKTFIIADNFHVYFNFPVILSVSLMAHSGEEVAYEFLVFSGICSGTGPGVVQQWDVFSFLKHFLKVFIDVLQYCFCFMVFWP